MWNVARSGLLSWLLILVSLGNAQQISKDEAVRLATGYAKSLGYAPSGTGDAKLVDTIPVGWHVTFDNASVMLELTGLLSSAFGGGPSDPDKLPPADEFANDDAAWDFAEDVLAPLRVPEGLHREGLYRERGYISLVFGVRPFGYPAQGGNSASVTIRAQDRQVVMVGIGRGWNYEAPNIKITEAEAIAIAEKHVKAPSATWTTHLCYWTILLPDSSEAIRTLFERQTSRLFYVIRSEVNGVIVDTVTGDVVTTGQLSLAHEPAGISRKIPESVAIPSKVYSHPKYKPIPKAVGFESGSTAPVAQDPAPEGTSLPLITGVAVVTGVVGFALGRWRR